MEERRFSTNHVASSTNFKYGSLVTAVCTHRCPPPSCHHIVLRKDASFYTDVGKITHEAITELCDGSVVEVGVHPSSCRVLFHKMRRDDFINYRFGEKAKKSRRFVHPSDLQSFCSIIGIQAGSRVLEVGAGYGHLTLLLSDLVGDSGHVIASSKNAFPTGVKDALIEWLERDGANEVSPIERYTNVTFHSIDVEDQTAAMRAISSALSSKCLIRDLDSVLPVSSSSMTSSDFSPYMLDAVTVLRMPEDTTHKVVESVLPLMKLGGAIGVVPLDFSHLQSLSDHIHDCQLPLYMEVVRQPERHGLFHSLERAQSSLNGESPLESHESRGAGDEEMTRREKDGNLEEIRPMKIPGNIGPRVNHSHLPKDFQSVYNRPHERLFWSRRRYDEVWIAKLVKVSSYEFVAEAEIQRSEQSRKEETERLRLLLGKEVEEIFEWTIEMQEEIVRQRKELEALGYDYRQLSTL